MFTKNTTMKMTEQTISLSVKLVTIIGAWFFAQVQPFAESGLVEKAFDQLFSIGLLVVFLIYVVYENRKKDKKQDEALEAYVELIRHNTKAIQNFAESNKDIAKSIERMADANQKAFERLENRL